MKKNLIIASVILFGILLRFFLASHAYRAIIFDAETYVTYALEFLRGSFPIDPREKNMGYPLFLAIVFWLRRGVDIEFVKSIQVFLDVFAGIFVWVGVQKIFSRKTADLALLLYMVNPFTASYVGLILTEALSCFLIGLLLVLVTVSNYKRNSFAWFLTGILLGILLFTRFSLFAFAVGSIITLSVLSVPKETIWKFFMITLAGFMLASSYSLVLNYKTFGKISPVPPYETNGGIVYLMFYTDRVPEVEFWGVNPEVTRVNLEYQQTPLSEISNWSKRYVNLFFNKLASEPFNFLSRYLKNIFWLWDKDHLFTYQDPWYPADRYFLRATNIILLFMGILGIVSYVRRGLVTLREPFVIVTLVLGAVMTLQYPLVSNENRHTIVFYPLLFFWAAHGVHILWSKVKY